MGPRCQGPLAILGVMGEFVPLSARSNPAKAAEFAALHDGVPVWMHESLIGWLEMQVPTGALGLAYIRKIERSLHYVFDVANLTWSMGPAADLRAALLQTVRQEPVLLLDVINWALTEIVSLAAEESLEAILSESGSLWRVGEDRLERRVSEETTAMANAVISRNQRASEHIAEAWKDAFGRNPDPTGAYDEAIKGVEAALVPIVSPKNQKATLGTIINDIESAPQKFVVRLGPPEMDGVSAFIQQLKLLWKGHGARHGTPDESIPQDVPPEKAPDAVVLATMIVHWAQSGAFAAAP